MVAALEVARAAASRMAVTTVAEGEAVAGREAATATVIARVRVGARVVAANAAVAMMGVDRARWRWWCCLLSVDDEGCAIAWQLCLPHPRVVWAVR